MAPTVKTAIATCVLAALAVASPAGRQSPDALTASDRRPAAPAGRFVSLLGQPLSLEFAGRVTLVNFWGTWCAPCREEVPDLVALQNAFGEQFQIVGLAVDDAERPATLEAFVRDHHVNYSIGLADDELIAAFGVIGVPTTFLIDTDARIAAVHRGRAPARTLEAQLRTLSPSLSLAGCRERTLSC